MRAVKTLIPRLLLSGRQEGFTLNEILISIALIAIGILGFSLNTIGVIQGNNISGHYTVATNLAQDKLEEFKVQTTFTDVDNCSTPPDQDLTATGGTGGIYDRCWKISNLTNVGNRRLKKIDVTVSWRDYINRSVTVSTFVFTDS